MKKKVQQKILELVKKNYDSIAEDFNQTRKGLQWSKLSEVTKQVGDGDYLLDAACGNGRLLDELQDKKINYLGVDNSVELIRCAQKNYPEHEFQVNDLLSLQELVDGSFDWVFCIAALHHLPGKDLRLKTLENLKAKMKKNGKMVISVWRPEKNKKFLQAQRRNFWRKIFFLSPLDFGDALFEWGGKTESQKNLLRYYHCFSEKELKKIIDQAGLKIINFYQDQHNFFMILERK